MSPTFRPHTARNAAPTLSAPQRWARWRAVLSAFEAQARTVIDTGGAALELTPELRHDFGALRSVPFPVDGVSGEHLTQAFRLSVQALIDVELPARRVASAEAVLGTVRALEALVLAEQARLTDVWRTRLGAGD